MINEKIVIEDKTADYNEAYIETYFWQESEELYLGQKRPAIVICPGGARKDASGNGKDLGTAP